MNPSRLEEADETPVFVEVHPGGGRHDHRDFLPRAKVAEKLLGIVHVYARVVRASLEAGAAADTPLLVDAHPILAIEDIRDICPHDGAVPDAFIAPDATISIGKNDFPFRNGHLHLLPSFGS